MLPTQIAYTKADGVDVFYRYAGKEDAPTIVLLHGYPTSSHMFRNLIPRLATKYRVIAPDLPGFGFTQVPSERDYKYTFENLEQTFSAFVDALGLQKFAIYIFDYGAPVGLRYAVKHQDAVTAIITQNGNAYVEGFGEDFWAPVKKYWESGASEDREALRGSTSIEGTRWQYENGAKNVIPPEAYHLDQTLMDRPGNKDIQLDLYYDYRNNVALYPKFQEYFRTSGVPILALWGKNDIIFIPPGAEAFRQDARVFESHWLDSGHFALETNEEVIAGHITKFLTEKVL